MVDDEDTVALAAAIRQPWQPETARPYEPAPPWPAPRPPAVRRSIPPQPVAYAIPVYAYPVVPVGQRQVALAYLLWFFLGALGIHHFYLGNILRGILYLFSGGFLGIGLLVDLFLIPSMTRRRNYEALGRAYQRGFPMLPGPTYLR